MALVGEQKNSLDYSTVWKEGWRDTGDQAGKAGQDLRGKDPGGLL